MIAQIQPLPSEWAGLFSEHSLVYVTAAWVLIQNAGRVYHAISAGGGITGIWHALVYGTSTPTVHEVLALERRKDIIVATNPPAIVASPGATALPTNAPGYAPTAPPPDHPYPGGLPPV